MKRLPLYGYIVLTLAIILTLGLVEREASHRRVAIATQSQKIARDGCHRSNETRKELRIIIRSSLAPLNGYEKRGLITPKEAQAARDRAADAIHRLRPTDCAHISISP